MNVTIYNYLLIIPLMLLSSVMGPRLMKKLHLDSSPVGRKIQTLVSKNGKPLKVLQGKLRPGGSKSAESTDENSSKELSSKEKSSFIKVVTGKASFYGDRHQGRKTASGKIYDMHQMTASHKSYPFGTLVKVTNLKNDRSVIVEITDRLPKRSTRTIDLSYRAAEELDMIKAGLAKVRLEIIDNTYKEVALSDSTSGSMAGERKAAGF